MFPAGACTFTECFLYGALCFHGVTEPFPVPQQALHQRWGELRALLARERRLLHGACGAPERALLQSTACSFLSPPNEGQGLRLGALLSPGS